MNRLKRVALTGVVYDEYRSQEDMIANILNYVKCYGL